MAATRPDYLPKLLIFDVDGHLQLDESVARESADAYGGANVAACFAEESNEEIGCAVDDGGGIGEAGCGVDVAVDGEDFCDGVEGAEFALENGELRESTGAGRGVAIFNAAICAGLAGDDAFRAGGDDAGEIRDGTDALEGDVVAAGRWWRWKSEIQFVQLFFYVRCGCHCVFEDSTAPFGIFMRLGVR
jgi:hypothetical protein